VPEVVADSAEGERPNLGAIPIRKVTGVHVAAASEDGIQRRIESLAPGED